MVATATNLHAQTHISLQVAILSAVKNNLSLRSEQLKISYQQKLLKASFVIPATSLIAEGGEINSANTDNRFGVMQYINLPTVYSAQKKLYQEELQSAVLNVALQQQQVKKRLQRCSILSW